MFNEKKWNKKTYYQHCETWRCFHLNYFISFTHFLQAISVICSRSVCVKQCRGKYEWSHKVNHVPIPQRSCVLSVNTTPGHHETTSHVYYFNRRNFVIGALNGFCNYLKGWIVRPKFGGRSYVSNDHPILLKLQELCLKAE